VFVFTTQWDDKQNLQALTADGVWTLYQGDCDQSGNKRIRNSHTSTFLLFCKKIMYSKEIMYTYRHWEKCVWRGDVVAIQWGRIRSLNWWIGVKEALVMEYIRSGYKGDGVLVHHVKRFCRSSHWHKCHVCWWLWTVKKLWNMANKEHIMEPQYHTINASKHTPAHSVIQSLAHYNSNQRDIYLASVYNIAKILVHSGLYNKFDVKHVVHVI